MAAMSRNKGKTGEREIAAILADLTGCAVYRPTETEATARGAAWLAAGRPSFWLWRFFD